MHLGQVLAWHAEPSRRARTTERLSDPTFGDAAGTTSIYYGPSLSLRAGPLWTAVSAATGIGVSEPASQVLFRWTVGVTR